MNELKLILHHRNETIIDCMGLYLCNFFVLVID